MWETPAYQPVEEREEKAEETEESETQEQRGVYETVEDAYQYLYDEVLSLSYSSSSPNYNAKGNFYAVFGKPVRVLMKTRKCSVYHRGGL